MVFGDGKKKGQFGSEKKELVMGEPGNHEFKGESPTPGQKNEEPEYTSLAFSLGRHPLSGFALYIVEFNPATGEARLKETRSTGESRAQSEDAFKVEVGHFFAAQELKGN